MADELKLDKLDKLFNNAVLYINNNKNKEINEQTIIEFYKYYKQATIGDINIEQPSFFDFKNKIKWEAWNSVKGMKREKAMCLYIKLLEKINPEWNFS